LEKKSIYEKGGTTRACADAGGRRGTLSSRGDWFGRKSAVEQEQLGLVLAQPPDGRERLEGHVESRVFGKVAPEMLEGAVALSLGLGVPPEVMAGHGQQQPVKRRGIGPRGRTPQDRYGRCPVAEEAIGRPEARQAIPLAVGLDPGQARFE
jgi:hypothetical protein